MPTFSQSMSPSVLLRKKTDYNTVVSPNKTTQKFSEKKTNKARILYKVCKVPLFGVIITILKTNKAISALNWSNHCTVVSLNKATYCLVRPKKAMINPNRGTFRMSCFKLLPYLTNFLAVFDWSYLK